MRSSLKLGRIAGIEIGIHYTWLLAFALVAWSLAEGFFPANYPGWTTATYWLAGIVAALALFASVLVHELSHSFVARARGQGVHSITLFIFGGVSNITGEMKGAADEFLISVVGPLTSFALAGLFWLLSGLPRDPTAPTTAVVDYLAFVNLLLGAFNLIPGFPLDGGRVFRSLVWAVTHDQRRATEIASYVGQAVGLGMVAWGLFRVLGQDVLGGLWTAFIGWFLNGAAESARHEEAMQRTLVGVPVEQIVDPEPPFVDEDLSIAQFVGEWVLRRGERAVLVGNPDRVEGIVTLTDIKEIPPEAWATTPLAAVMTRAPLRTVPRNADLVVALRLLGDGQLNQVPVVDGVGRTVGLLTRAALVRYLHLRDELHLGRPPRVAA